MKSDEGKVEVSDVDIIENEGEANIAGGDITKTVVGDTTIGEIFNSINTSINIPADNSDEKLTVSLENARTLLKESKRSLAKLVMNKSNNTKEIRTAIRNIKMSGDNISNLINALSVRGVACKHLTNEDSYEQEIIEILSLKNMMKYHHIHRVCPYCGEKIIIKNTRSNIDMVAAIKKPKVSFLIFDKCTSYKTIDNLSICRMSSMYCGSCKKSICVYFSKIESSVKQYIDKAYPN